MSLNFGRPGGTPLRLGPSPVRPPESGPASRLDFSGYSGDILSNRPPISEVENSPRRAMGEAIVLTIGRAGGDAMGRSLSPRNKPGVGSANRRN